MIVDSGRSHRTMAVPVGASVRATAEVSMPSARSRSRTMSPSVPTAPTMATPRPSRAAVAAWLAPLPPVERWRSRAATVSPLRGTAATSRRWSMLMLPTTTTSGATRGLTSGALVEGAGQPAHGPVEEGAVALPAHELLGGPVRGDVRGEGEGPALPDLPHREQRRVLDGREDDGVVLRVQPLVAQEDGPVLGQRGGDGVGDLGAGPADALRGLDAVVVGRDLHRQHVLDGGAVVVRLALE